jgi:chromatin remodeling complex protein RSC6
MATKKKAKAKSAPKAKAKAKAKAKPAAKAKAKAKPAKAKTKRKPNAAFMKAMSISPTLQAVVGGSSMPRTEVTKKVWAYIKKNNLQDAKERRNINADANLQKVFNGKKTVNMFEMTKLINNHLS